MAAGDARGGGSEDGRRDRTGRRDNGLVAAEYAVAGDVDPRLGEHLLDVLALDGIAAYLRPSTDLHPVTRTTTLPARPTDRLYVDRTHLEAARGYLERLRADERRDEDTLGGEPPGMERPGLEPPGLGPPGRESRGEAAADGGDDPDIDAAWAAIVAGYHADRTAGAWPDADEVARDGEESRGAGTALAPRGLTDGRPAIGDDISLLDGLDRFGAHLPDDDEEGYVPPPPPPLPRPTTPTVLAATAIGLGFLLVLWPELLPIGRDSALLLGFMGIIAGFVTLVWRLRPGDDDDDIDNGDGAKV